MMMSIVKSKQNIAAITEWIGNEKMWCKHDRESDVRVTL